MDRRHFVTASAFAATRPWLLAAANASAAGSVACAVNVKDYGATGDGSTDDTAALRAALAAVGASGAMVCVPPGTYLVSGVLSLPSKTYVKGAGRSTVFKRVGTATDTVFFSQSVSDVTVESIAVDMNGAQAATTNQKSFATAIGFRTGCSDVRIRDVRVFDSAGVNVCCRHGILVLESSRVWIEQCHLTDGFRIKAIGVGDELVVARNIVEGANDNAISLATLDSPSTTTNCLVVGNIVKDALGYFIYVGDDGASSTGMVVQNVVIDGNVLVGTARGGMILVRLASVTERLHIVNNIVTTVGPAQQFTAGIQTTIQTTFGKTGADFLIAHNTVSGAFNHAGVWIQSVNNIRVAQNQISNSSPGDGLRITGVDTGILEGNVIVKCRRGIWFTEPASRNLRLVGNSISGCTEHGVTFEPWIGGAVSASAHFLSNTISGNSGAAIHEDPNGTFDTHYVFNDLRGNAGGALSNVHAKATRLGNLGTDDNVLRHISATSAWNPPAAANGAFQTKTLTVSGARLGDTVVAGFNRTIPPGAFLTGAVIANDLVRVTLVNMSGAQFDLGSGIVRADVWRH